MTSAAEYYINESNLERQRLLAHVLNPFTRSFLALLTLPPNARCLDVGCGIGETTRLIASVLTAGGECVGLERDPALIAVTKQQTHHLPVKFEQGDAMQLPYGDGSFDFVFARYLMMHLPDPGTAIREMMRVAGKSGIVMLVEPDFSFQASHPHSWAYERLPELLRALLPDPFIGRKLGDLLRQAGVNELHMEATSGIEHGDSSVRRTWRMTIEAMGSALVEKNIVNPAELSALITELGRMEKDADAVLLYNHIVCAWGRV